MMENDPIKQREVVKKVIAFMTLGIDVTRLFPEMVKVSRTSDIVTKKMIYLYLVTYAEKNQELAILAINAFLMDFKDRNGKVRGYALRSLCSMGFEGVESYMEPLILEGLNDNDAYVRKTAIIGCIKYYHLVKEDPEKFTGFSEHLFRLLKDHDTQVIINAIEAINIIYAEQGGLEVNQSLVISLLNRIKEFTEWG